MLYLFKLHIIYSTPFLSITKKYAVIYTSFTVALQSVPQCQCCDKDETRMCNIMYVHIAGGILVWNKAFKFCPVHT